MMSSAHSTFGRLGWSKAVLLVLTVISIADGRQSFAGAASRLHAAGAALASDAAILELASIEPAKPQSHRSSRSGAPPEVSITSPTSGALAPRKRIIVEAVIADGGDGIGQVIWRINGAVLSAERNWWFERIDLPLSSIRKSIAVEQSLSLSCGMNRVEVIAHSAKPPFRSRTAKVSIKWDGRELMAVRFQDPAAIVCDEWNGRFT